MVLAAQPSLSQDIDGSPRIEKADSLLSAAWGAYYLGNYDLADEYATSALSYCDRHVNLATMARCENLMALCHTKLGEYMDADTHCRTALAIYDQDGCEREVAATYRYIAYNCIMAGYMELGGEYIDKAATIDSVNNTQHHASDLLSKAHIDYLKYRHLDSEKDSLLYAARQKTREVFSLIPNPDDEIIVYAGAIELTAWIFNAMAQKAEPGSELRAAYADSAYSYCKIANLSANGVRLEALNFRLRIAQGVAFAMAGNGDSLNSIVAETTHKFIREPRLLRTLGDYYCEMLIDYYTMEGDYLKALEYFKKRRQLTFGTYNIDLYDKIDRLKSQEWYTRYNDRMQLEDKERDEAFREKSDQLKFYSMICGFWVFALAIWVLYLRSRRQHADEIGNALQNYNNTIIGKNIELRCRENEFHKLKRKYEHEQDELAKRKKDFIEANRQIRSELLDARQIQNALMPSKFQMQQIFGACLVHWKPLQTVSGDFYWAIHIRDTKVIVVADCTGHGVPGAFMSMLGISTLNNVVTARNIEKITAASIVEKMREKVIALLHQSCSEESELYDGMDMAVCILRDQQCSLQFAGANRPIVIAGVNGVKEYQPDDMPAGIDFLGDRPFINHTVTFQHGDVLYMYSDGITDQFGGANGKKKFSSKKLRTLIGEMWALPFDEQMQRLQSEVFDWTTIFDEESLMEQYRPQLDDQLLIGIHL